MIHMNLRWLAALCLMLTFLNGCADNRPLNYRALVLTLGFAPAAQQKITVYFQIPTPSGLTSLSTGGSAMGSGQGGKTTYTLEATAKTVARAFTEAQADVNQDLYLGQLQAVILSTHLTGAQFADIASTLTRVGTLDKTAYALATPAPVGKVLTTTSATTPLAPLYFSSEFGCTYCQTVNAKRQVWDVEKAQYGPPVVSLWLPVITPTANGFRLSAIALYRRDRPAWILKAHQTTLLGYSLGKTAKGTLHLTYDGMPVSVRSLRARSHMSIQWSGSRLTILDTMKMTGDVDAFPLKQPLAPHLSWVQQESSALVSREASALFQRLSNRDLDPWTIGAGYLWQHPGKTRHWLDAYRHARWRVRVKMRLRELGDTT
ncbi:Ger(x)C family spore germination C-terminal domain-containing protein [Sulfobacillus harzensis]|uniref:Uncharacterized protein n=1 Tax=Sulfobacillus harzensis TaxID=2729629 RepID=A0A7Y0L6I9_9FIRM|nr:Ger(x)C family spore germination C-terminal domain-containing protein [Sulfobacillus harzensis]NMP24192.1 hypothetical protein [Sulfobacillus harzensis]